MTDQDIAVLTTCKHGKNWQDMQDDRCETDNSEYDRYGSRVLDPGFFQIPDPGVCTSNGEIFSNVYVMNVLDIIKRHLFCFYIFVVRRPLNALEPRIRSEFPPDPDL